MKWRLKDYLARNNITAHQLALESKLSLNSVYPAVRGQAERVSLATLDRMLAALDQLTGQRVELTDLLERDDAAPGAQPEKRGWLELAGTFDDPTSPGDIAAQHDDYLGKALLEEHREGLEGKR